MIVFQNLYRLQVNANCQNKKEIQSFLQAKGHQDVKNVSYLAGRYDTNTSFADNKKKEKGYSLRVKTKTKDILKGVPGPGQY